MAQKLKIVALGPSEELLCLKSAGVEFVELGADDDLEATLRRYARDAAIGLIILSEASIGDRYAVVAAVRRETGAVLLVVPSYRGSRDTTLAFMKHTLEQSIGVDLISKS